MEETTKYLLESNKALRKELGRLRFLLEEYRIYIKDLSSDKSPTGYKEMILKNISDD